MPGAGRTETKFLWCPISPGSSPLSNSGCLWHVCLNKNLSLGNSPIQASGDWARDSKSDHVVWLALGDNDRGVRLTLTGDASPWNHPPSPTSTSPPLPSLPPPSFLCSFVLLFNSTIYGAVTVSGIVLVEILERKQCIQQRKSLHGNNSLLHSLFSEIKLSTIKIDFPIRESNAWVIVNF